MQVPKNFKLLSFPSGTHASFLHDKKFSDKKIDV